MKIKILHIISSLKIGGAEQVLYQMLGNLNEYEHKVLFFHDGPFREKINALGIETVQIKGLICKYDPIFIFNILKNIIIFKPNVIHASLWAANFFARIFGKILKIPVLGVIHIVPEHDGKFRNFLDKISLSLTDEVVAVSDSVHDSLINNKFIKNKEIKVIKNGINSFSLLQKGMSEKISRSELNLDENNFVIANVGRFVKHKNQDLLIKSFYELFQVHNEARLVLLGIGPELNNLKKFVNELNLNNYVQFIVGQPAYKYYPIFDCFVLPSSFEGLSISLLEALSFGLPCIVTENNRGHDVLKHNQTGIIINENVNDLTENLIKLIEDKNLYSQLSVNGQKLVKEEYDFETMINSYKKVINNLVIKKAHI
ncbi:glycosyltransferase [Candidatus Dependentiae bacterium]|nr:glycosyltransferase [Candidatus Dependentiae bacterium]